jgi:hypothetical protein
MTERYHCVPGSNMWHSTSRCSLWPRLDYWSRAKLPVGGELCGECGQLVKNDGRSWRAQSEHV